MLRHILRLYHWKSFLNLANTYFGCKYNNDSKIKPGLNGIVRAINKNRSASEDVVSVTSGVTTELVM